ncbi:MAG: alpha/beta fold hydrolase [Limosilactobacillus gorillae]|jgi:uncharacterized protein|uniref:alpha/beta hydrolase n=1 Tax=Limosilactobacillus gorillae TaxID=1450649 RepID=UPI000AAE7EFB|nr:alpha/beta fold hydrolase [Limosilactobacillus gorillae]MDO4855448.1 alpha/beta fold hydrolase [Limosilactobacillus gorillae]
MEVSIERDGLTLRGLLEGSNQVHNKRIAILMHGFKGDLGYTEESLLNQVAHRLNAQGLATLRFDFAGCGHSDGRFLDMTVFSEILDGMKIIEYARQRVGAKEIILVGHSQGGVVASMLAAYFRDVITKLVLLAPAATLKDDALIGTCQGTNYDPKHIPATVNVGGFAVGGDYFRTAQLLPIYETAQHFAGPVLMIHGLADTVVDPRASQKYNIMYQNGTIHFIKGASHQLNGDGDQRTQTLQLVADFLV